MKITNDCNLPAPLVRAVTWSDRDREGCDYTVTELIKPPRIAALERLHADEITEDASDRLWMLLGSAGHEVLRRSAKDGIVEERAIVEVDGKKVGGQIDYADNMIWDYKFCSVWVVKDGPRPDWIQQLNAYRYMAHQYGVEVAKLQICAIFRDWSKREAARNADYPQTQVQVFDLPMWEYEETERWLKQRIILHEIATVSLPECSDEEVWAKPPKWAVKKKGNVRALKLYDNEEEAMKHVSWGQGLEVEFRRGERPRCESYCACAPFCEQFKAWQQANKAAC